MLSRLVAPAALVASLLLLCSAAGAQAQPEEAPPVVPEAERLLDDIQRLRSEYRALQEEEGNLEGEERAVIENLLERARR